MYMHFGFREVNCFIKEILKIINSYLDENFVKIGLLSQSLLRVEVSGASLVLTLSIYCMKSAAYV